MAEAYRGMFDRATLIFEMIKTVGLLYEVKHGGPEKLAGAMDRFSRAAYYDPDKFNGQDAIESWEESAEQMAKAFMEYTYNGASIPRWLEKIESGLRDEE